MTPPPFEKNQKETDFFSSDGFPKLTVQRYQSSWLSWPNPLGTLFCCCLKYIVTDNFTLHDRFQSKYTVHCTVLCTVQTKRLIFPLKKSQFCQPLTLQYSIMQCAKQYTVQQTQKTHTVYSCSVYSTVYSTLYSGDVSTVYIFGLSRHSLSCNQPASEAKLVNYSQ